MLLQLCCDVTVQASTCFDTIIGLVYLLSFFAFHFPPKFALASPPWKKQASWDWNLVYRTVSVGSRLFFGNLTYFIGEGEFRLSNIFRNGHQYITEVSACCYSIDLFIDVWLQAQDAVALQQIRLLLCERWYAGLYIFFSNTDCRVSLSIETLEPSCCFIYYL